MAKSVTDLASIIAHQEKEIIRLREELEKSKDNTSKYISKCNDYNDRIRALKLEYGAAYGGDGMFKQVQEALKVQTDLNKHLIEENKMLHKRYDEAYGGIRTDKAAKQRMAKSIIGRLNSIEILVKELLKEG